MDRVQATLSLDPTTGTGAYLIDGGANGGILLIVLGFLLIAVAIFALVALIATTGGVGLGVALSAAPEFFAAIMVGIAMIARGYELFSGSYTACKIYRFSLGVALGAFLAKYNWILGLLVGSAYSAMGEFLDSDSMCVDNP